MCYSILSNKTNFYWNVFIEIITLQSLLLRQHIFNLVQIITASVCQSVFPSISVLDLFIFLYLILHTVLRFHFLCHVHPVDLNNAVVPFIAQLGYYMQSLCSLVEAVLSKGMQLNADVSSFIWMLCTSDFLPNVLSIS